jgi:hypothetical protein
VIHLSFGEVLAGIPMMTAPLDLFMKMATLLLAYLMAALRRRPYVPPASSRSSKIRSGDTGMGERSRLPSTGESSVASCVR